MPHVFQFRPGEHRIAEIIGRHARLTDGSFVSAIPPFFEFNYDQAAFDAAIAEFQADPEGVLMRGIVEYLPPPAPRVSVAERRRQGWMAE